MVAPMGVVASPSPGASYYEKDNIIEAFSTLRQKRIQSV